MPGNADEDYRFRFSEYRVVGTYRAGLSRGTRPDADGAVEQGPRSSFNFTRKGGGGVAA
jgi:hypothetical protein